MKKFLSLSLATLLMMSVFAGCTPAGPTSSSKTPEELTSAYQEAIQGARSQEENDAFPMVTSKDHELADMLFQMLGVTADDMTAYAISVSPMNTQAYGIAAIMPADDKSETVLKGVNAFVELQKSNFDMYLMDQYDIAAAAKVETLDDGTILLVMCEGQDDVFTAIKDALSK